MKQILAYLALIDLNSFCAAQRIDYSSSRLWYEGRFKYSLVAADGTLLASVQFHKNQVPTHYKPMEAK